MPDAHRNFAVSTVATAPSPATSGTSLVVAAGHGSRFPVAPFNATVWPAGASPDPSNAEIVRVTAISTDTLTITRAQESTTARSITAGDRIAATVTAKTLEDAELGATHAGSSAPVSTLGADGDWFELTVRPFTRYRKISGTWTALNNLVESAEEIAALRSSPWNARVGGYSLDVSAATVAGLFRHSQTNVTKSGSTFTATNGNAYGGYAPCAGVLASCTVSTMPGAGQVLGFGAAMIVATTGAPYVEVNNAGVARVNVSGVTAKTFSGTVSTSANNEFVTRIIGGVFLVAQVNGGVVVDSAVIPNVYLNNDYANGPYGFKGFGFVMLGYGAVSLNFAEVLTT